MSQCTCVTDGKTDGHNIDRQDRACITWLKLLAMCITNPRLFAQHWRIQQPDSEQSHDNLPSQLLEILRLRLLSYVIIIIIIINNIKAICNAQDPPRRPQMRCPAVRKCSCLYTMYHMNNNVFSSVLKVVRLKSDTLHQVLFILNHYYHLEIRSTISTCVYIQCTERFYCVVAYLVFSF